MSSYSSDASRSGARSPLFGTATFSTLTQSESSPTRYSYSSHSGISSDDSDIPGTDMRRITVSPSPPTRHSGSDLYSWSEEDSIHDAAEVEAALSALDNELDQTEDALTEWSRGSSVTQSSYLSGSASSPSFTTTDSSYIPFTNTLRDGRILSTITERTEHPSSRPTSYNLSVPGSRPVSDAIRRSAVSHHPRGVAEPVSSVVTPSRRTGDLIAFFEDKSSSSDSPAPPYSPHSHRRAGSVPSGPRSPSPYTQTSQSIPTFATTTYGYGSSTDSRPSSPSKSWSSQSQSYVPGKPSRSFLSPPLRAGTTGLDSGPGSPYTSSATPTNSNTFTSTSYTATSTSATTQGTSLRRPQTSPRSPLSSVRNIVAAWKSRSPSIDKSSQFSSSKSSTDLTPEEGFFSIRRRAGRGFKRERHSDGSEFTPGMFKKGDPSHDYEDINVPSTPRTSTSLTSSGIVPPPFDLTELGTFAKGSQEPLRIGLLWYLNVHAPPPYRWQRCQAVLYPNMLLLSWIAQGGGRGIVTLDLLNCTEVRSVASPTHPSAQDDVGTIAAKAQTANAQAEGFGELGLMETLCPFQLFYSDGVERLGAESARERVRWVSAIWEVLDRSVTVPDRSETQSPTGSMRTIRSMVSTSTHSGSVESGSRSTTFVPPMDTIPDLSDFHSFSGSSSGSLSHQPSLRSRAVDDAAISNQTLTYLGDPRVIAPSRSSSLRRTTSMTDLGEEFESALRRAKDARPGLGFGLGLAGAIIGEGSPVTVSSGPTLRRDVIVTPPPSTGRGGSRPRTAGSEFTASVSDDAFFSSGARSSGDQSSFRSLSSTPSGVHIGNPGTETSSVIPTEGTSSSETVVPQAYRGGEGTSYLGSSTDVRRSAFTSDLPSGTTGLTRSRAVRARRDNASSVSHSSSSFSGTESFSDRENASSNTHSRSYSEYSPGDGFSTLESYSRSTYTRSANGTPLPSSSSEHSPESESDPITTATPTSSTQYETARSPSIMSFASLPSIPSLYETAEVCSTESEATKSVSSLDLAKASHKAESVSDYITAPVCESEPTSPYTTAEICPTEASTEYDDAECRCKPEKVVVSEGTQVAAPEPIPEAVRVAAPQPVEEAARVITQPSGEAARVTTEPVEVGVQVAIPPRPSAEPAEAVRVTSPEPIPEPPVILIEHGFPPSPPDDFSTISSPDIGSISPVSTRMSAMDVPLPGSVSSPSFLSSELSLPSELLISSELPPSERSAEVPLPPVSAARPTSPVPPYLPGPSPIGSPPTTTLLSSVTGSTPSTITPSGRSQSSSPTIPESLWAPETDDTYESSVLRASPSVQSIAFPEGPDISFDTSFLRPTASAYTSQEPSRLSTIDESPSGESSSIIYSPSSSPSVTPTPSVSLSVSAATPSLSPSPPPTVPSPSLRAPSSTPVPTPIMSPEPPPFVSLTRSPSTVSTVSSISLRSDILDNGSLFLEDVSTVPSLLSTHRSSVSRAIPPPGVPLPSSPSLLSTPSAPPSVSMTSPRGSTPSIYSDLVTIPSERPPSERPTVIITDDINRLLQYLHGLEGDRQHDNRGIHDHLGDIENELRNLGDYIREREAPEVVLPPVQLKDRSVGGSSVVSWREPRGAPDYPSKPPTVTVKAGPPLVPIPLTPPPRIPTPSTSLSSSISFLSSHHSDDLSLMESELSESESYFQEESSSPISSSPPSTSSPSSPSSSPSSETLPLTPISQSPLSSGEYLSRTSVSPTPSVVSSATVRPTAPGIDRNAINRIREVLDAVKDQTDALWDGQLSTNHLLDELRQRVPRAQDNAELVERLQRIEDLINRLADAQRRTRPPTPEESLFDSGSDTSTAIRRLRERWDRLRRETPTLIAPTPLRPRTSLDDMMTDLLRPPQPPAPVQIQPPPTFVPLNFRPDARGPRPRSASPTLLTELPPLRPFTVPITEPFITRDVGRRPPRPARRITRPSALAPTQFPPAPPPRVSSETPVTRVGPDRRPRPEGPDFLDLVHDLRRRRTGEPDGQVHPRPEGEPEPPLPPIVDAEPGRPTTAPAVFGPWNQPPPPPPPGAFGLPGAQPVPVLPPFTQSVILPPIFNDMMAMVRENRFMHLASLEQQRELMRYMNSLNEWLGNDVEDRQAALRSIFVRLDQLRDMYRLGFPQGPGFPQPGAGFEPGGFMMPGPGGPGPPGPPGPGAPVVPVFRPGTVPPPPQVQVPFPRPAQPFTGVVPSVIPPFDGYESSTASGSLVIPSPPSPHGSERFVAPPIGTFPGGVVPAPTRVYEPPPPGEGPGEDMFIPSSPSRTPTGSPRPSEIPIVVPGPQIAPPPGPPIMVYPPSQGSQYQYPVSRPPESPRTPSPPFLFAPSAPPQPAPVVSAAPGVPLAPAQPAPPGPSVVQILPSPIPPRSESEFGPEWPQQPGHPIIIQPPQQVIPPGVQFPPQVFPPPPPTAVAIPGPLPSRSRSRSPTPSRSTRSPSYEEGPPGPPPVMFAPGPQGVGLMPAPVRPISMLPPSQPFGPEYPPRPPSRYSEGPIQPFPPMGPSAIHIVPPEPYPTRYPRGRRYSESRTPPSERSLSPEHREPDDRRRSASPPRSPGPVYPIPPSVGPSEYARPAFPPPSVPHIYPQPPLSPSIISGPLAEEREPLRHPYGPPTQFQPSEQVPVPIGIPPSTRPRASRAPTIVEVTGREPEPIQVLPPDLGRPRAESVPYQPPISGPVSDIYREDGRPRSPTLESQLRSASPSVPFVPHIPSQVAPSQLAREAIPEEIEPETFGHIPPGSETTPEEEEEPYGAPRSELPGVSRAPTTPGAPLPGVSRAPTTREVPGTPFPPTARDIPGAFPRIPSGPGGLDYDDAEQGRQERFGEIERQLADVAQDAAEAEIRREHDFLEREADRDRQFAERQADRARQFDEDEGRRETEAKYLTDELRAQLPVPPGVPGAPVPAPDVGAPLPSDVLGVPERAESVIASIRRASTESAARHADDIRDIVQGEREEMARQLQLDREETRAAREELERQLLAERQRADEECKARIRELEEELARVRAQLDHERQQRDHDEELRREADTKRDLERDEDMRQQLSEITDLLLQHRDEFARKREVVDERWNEKLAWHQERDQQFETLSRMIQGIIDDRAEERERCEEERRAAAERPSTQDIIDELRRENQTLRELFETLTDTLREDTERQHRELLDTVESTARERVPFNVQGYLDEFSKSLATEVRMLLGEVGKLREERRNIQFEIGTLLCLRSNYNAGGMFDPDWKPPTDPLAPQQPADLPPDEPPAPGPSAPRPGAWRSIQPRGRFRRDRKGSGPRPAGPITETMPPPGPPPGPPPEMPPDRAQAAGSWATWQVQPGLQFTPPPGEPMVQLGPEVAPSPRGLFGPRSPRAPSQAG